MNKARLLAKIVLPIVAAVLPGFANAGCMLAAGTVKLMPDASCKVEAALASSGVVFTHECFSVSLSLVGFPTATGHTGLTAEAVVGANNGMAMAPAVIPGASPTDLPRQIIQTARTVLSMGVGARKTTLYSNDVIVIKPVLTHTGQVLPAAVTEQIIISGTDGQGAYANYTGFLSVVGNSIGAAAPVAGKLCTP